MACALALTDTGEPRFDAPSLNWTVPVGVAVPADLVTLAVNVTGFPEDAGFSEELSAVFVEPWPAVNVLLSRVLFMAHVEPETAQVVIVHVPTLAFGPPSVSESVFVVLPLTVLLVCRT